MPKYHPLTDKLWDAASNEFLVKKDYEKIIREYLEEKAKEFKQDYPQYVTPMRSIREILRLDTKEECKDWCSHLTWDSDLEGFKTYCGDGLYLLPFCGDCGTPRPKPSVVKTDYDCSKAQEKKEDKPMGKENCYCAEDKSYTCHYCEPEAKKENFVRDLSDKYELIYRKESMVSFEGHEGTLKGWCERIAKIAHDFFIDRINGIR